jgi:hypothetical protein
MSIEAMKKAKEFADNCLTGCTYLNAPTAQEIFKLLDKAIAEAEKQEPVGEAYLCDKCQTPFDGAWECPSCGHNTATKEPVYTKPQPSQKPLTDEQISAIVERLDPLFLDTPTGFENDFVQAIEAAHGIKE